MFKGRGAYPPVADYDDSGKALRLVEYDPRSIQDDLEHFIRALLPLARVQAAVLNCHTIQCS